MRETPLIRLIILKNCLYIPCKGYTKDSIYESNTLFMLVKPLSHQVVAVAARGVHLTRFWSGTCHRGFKNIPVPYTNVSKKYIRPYVFHIKILKRGTVSYTKIVKIDTVVYTNICRMETLPDGTSPYPKYM